MHTRRTIGLLLLLGLLAVAVAAGVGLVALLGWRTGTVTITLAAAMGWALLRLARRPWYQAGGASTSDGRRRVSRFRVPRRPPTFAAAAWSLLADPGWFLMEGRMLLGIKRRAESDRRSDDATLVRT